MPYPYEVADVLRHDLIDLDEYGLFVKTASKHIGKACMGNRVRYSDNHSHSEKMDAITYCGWVFSRRARERYVA